MLARSEYHGAQFQVNKRLSRGFTGQVSYTVGKAMDTGSDVQVGALPVDARALDLEWAVADFDVRHRFVANWLWEVPFFRDASGLKGALLRGWQINGITALQSGFPFNVSTSAAYPTGDYNGDGVNNDRPNQPSFGLELPDNSRKAYIDGVFLATAFPRPEVLGDLPRNAYRGPGFASTDLSFFKNFALRMPRNSKLQFRAEVFNLFNRVNLQRPNGNLSQATFGRSTQAFAAREIQFALKLIF
jgi:hypothetical protein